MLPQSPRYQQPSSPSCGVVRGTKSPTSTIESSTAPLDTHPVAVNEGGVIANPVRKQIHALADTVDGVVDENNEEEEGPGCHANVESSDHNLKENDLSEDMQRVLRGKNLNFQAPQAMPKKASKSRGTI